MFQFLFKYPIPVFTRGHFVLLSTWPAWLLPVFIAAAGGGLALLIRWRLRDAAPRLSNWRAWIVWLMQWATLALLLLLLWQPAMTVSELSSQQNIIAVVVDDSRSMATSDVNGRAREDAALEPSTAGSSPVSRIGSRRVSIASTPASSAWTAPRASRPREPPPASTMDSSS